MKLNDKTLLKTNALIDGEWVSSDTNDVLPVKNPATGDIIAEVAKSSANQTKIAIDASADAMEDWKNLPAKARANLLRTWFELMITNQEDLAKIMTAEQGKTLAESRGEIAYGAAFIEWFGEQAKRIDGDIIPGPSKDKRIVCIKQPVGVVAAITPWNFPNAMIARKAAPALAAGCSIVIKPASETPLSALAMGELSIRAGIPKGVINILAGNSSEIGAEMTSNPIVRKLTFTGSTEIGKLLEAQCASTMKKTSMELGGNAPFIVFEDADIDAAVSGAMISKYRNAGQTCACSNRILLHDAIYDEFLEKFLTATKQLTIGNGIEDHISIGPLINEKTVRDVDELVQAFNIGC